MLHLDLGLARSRHVKLVGGEGRRRPLLVDLLLLSVASSFLQVLRLHVFHRNLFCVSLVYSPVLSLLRAKYYFYFIFSNIILLKLN